MTEGDVDLHFDAQRRELDRLTVLNLVATPRRRSRLTTFAASAKS